MRIKSPFVDYYDYVVLGDKSIYYDRKPIIEEVNINIPTTFKTLTFLSYDKMCNLTFSNDTDGLYCFGILKIGNLTKPFIAIRFFTSNYQVKYLHFYEYDNFMNFLSDKIPEYQYERYKKYFNEFKEYFSQDLSKVLISNEPITLYYISRHNKNKFVEIQKNISLVDVMFHLVPQKYEEIYQEIEMFIANKNAENVVLIKDDNTIRDAKGFNKQSFRS